MKFEFKTQKELAEMTEGQVTKYQADLEAHRNEQMKGEVSNVVKSEIDKATETLKEFLGKEIAGQLAEQSRGNATEEIKSIREQIKEQLTSKSEDIEAMKTDRKATMTIEVKAAADMLISTNTSGRVARQDREAGTNRIVRRRPFIMDSVTVTPTNGNTLYWVDQINPDGTPTMTAEGATKPQIDWDYIERSRPVRKLPAFTKVSKEMLDDIDGFASDIENELTERILLVADEQVLSGDGTGQNLVGISVNATPFSAGGLANAVPSANEVDCLRAGVAQVYRQLFVPTKIYVHPDMEALMDLQKASDGTYLLPPFVTSDGMRVRGIEVESNTGVGVGDFYVGDFSKYKVKVREGFSIQLGYDGNDWTKNMITPLAEMRLGGYISSNNYGAIVKGTFAVAKALLDPDVADS